MKACVTRLVDQEIAPRVENGTDYGREGKVLVRKGDLSLVWRGPGMVWSGTGRPFMYCLTSLDVRTEGRAMSSPVHKGGRLSKKLIAACWAEIDRQFGKGVADAIDINKTLVIGE